MAFWQALLIGALQGFSELFPVSSLAHTILIPYLLNWGLDQQGSNFLAFVVALHLATAIALLIYFWKDWRDVIMAFVGSFKGRQLVYDRNSKFAWLLVAGTVVVGVIGLLFEKQLSKFFEDPGFVWIVAAFLVLNGGLMIYGEYYRRRLENRPEEARQAAMSGPRTGARDSGVHSYPTFQSSQMAGKNQTGFKNVEELSFLEGGLVGAAQTLALIPGISRSGVTILGGLLAGLSHEEAARFAFMLATPVIGLAALLKVPELLKPEARDILGMTIAAAVLAGITAYLSVRFLMRYFETKSLRPFGFYCIYLGLIVLIIVQLRK
jgi:undecaprenyl-diphosphatase